MLDALRATWSGGQAGRWQYKGRSQWNDFSEQSTKKLQHAQNLGVDKVNIWEDGKYMELDFKNMVRMPGRHPFRVGPAKPEASDTASASASAAELSREVARVHSPSRRRRSMRIGSPTRKSRPLSTSCTWLPSSPEARRGTLLADSLRPVQTVEMTQAEGFKAIVHPCFLDLKKPRFAFRQAQGAEEHKEFMLQERLALCEDDTERVMCMASFYSELLIQNEIPELPLKVSPALTMAALAFAFYKAGAARLTPNSKLWYFADRWAEGRASATPPPATTLPSLSKSSSVPLLKKKPTGEEEPFGAAQNCVTFRIPGSNSNRSHTLKIIQAWQEWYQLTKERHRGWIPTLPVKDGSFDYLFDHDKKGRIDRIGGACSVLWWTAIKLQNPAERVSMYTANRDRTKGQVFADYKPEIVGELNQNPLDIALRLMERGMRVGAVVICNRDDDIGGGLYSTGALDNPEAEVCMRTDMYSLLCEAERQAVKQSILDSRLQAPYVPEIGCVACKDVKVFRDDASTGFEAYEGNPVILPAMICVSLMNLNPLQDTTAERRLELKQFCKDRYFKSMICKFEMVLKAAHDLQLDAIVLSDAIARKLHHEPRQIGSALGEALNKAKFKLPKIIMSGCSAFLQETRIKTRQV
eukprot:TRINITY_DN10071_c0_g1_i1.p1 TRINITY_DN10071_c0_g1~~TRINITY_DN10071_c0_g1_i1.p1  ORF type:complete len:638 (+),score=107.61 TRINITY_DN10071_c0_g1_i1:164-2077(+)